MYSNGTIPTHQRPLLRLLTHIKREGDGNDWAPVRDAWALFRTPPGPDAATCDYCEAQIRRRFKQEGAEWALQGV